MKSVKLSERLFSNLGVELCDAAIEIAGQRLEPDKTKAYTAFKISHPWPSVTAYGTTLHPGTVANSWKSMQHQVFNYGHQMRVHDKSKERNEIRRDYIFGSIVAVDFPNAPATGWKMNQDRDQMPAIHAAAVIHKQAEKVPAVLGEHLGGRHKWTVSMEVNYDIVDSGFLVMDRAQAKGKAAALMNETTPEEFSALGLGYVPATEASEELLDTYNFETFKMRPKEKGLWQGLPVMVLKNGINGEVHYGGVGMVRYGAEREAEIQQLLASDPNAIEWDEVEQDAVKFLADYFRALS